MAEKTSRIKYLTAGIIKENPVLVLILGTCPALATTTSAINGAGMGLAATMVLLGSNIVISILRNAIPNKVRIPCFIVIIAGFVTIVQMLLQAFVPSLYDALGIFLPLIVVNCIILGRAEAFASKNTVFDSILDAIGMGIGFTVALVIFGIVRELIGYGTLFGIQIYPEALPPMAIMGLAPGGFFVYGCVIAGITKLTKGRAIKKTDFDCAGCAMAASCKGGCEK